MISLCHSLTLPKVNAARTQYVCLFSSCYVFEESSSVYTYAKIADVISKDAAAFDITFIRSTELVSQNEKQGCFAHKARL